MTDQELAKKLAARSKLSEAEALSFIDAFTSTLADYFKAGERVIIAEFGSFYIKDDKTIQFNPSAKLKELID